MEEREDEREADGDQHKDRHQSEQRLVDGAHLRHRAHVARLAGLDRTEERTVDRIQRDLSSGEYVRRFIPGDDDPQEGAFLACSFWMVSALLIIDRGAEAESLFERLLARANDVALYAEEADPATHAFLGNFPQALTHLALIEAAVNLELYRKGGAAAVGGGPADRASRAVGATAGVRGLWAALRKSGRIGRVRSSRASMMPDGWPMRKS